MRQLVNKPQIRSTLICLSTLIKWGKSACHGRDVSSNKNSRGNSSKHALLESWQLGSCCTNSSKEQQLEPILHSLTQRGCWPHYSDWDGKRGLCASHLVLSKVSQCPSASAEMWKHGNRKKSEDQCKTHLR